MHLIYVRYLYLLAFFGLSTYNEMPSHHMRWKRQRIQNLTIAINEKCRTEREEKGKKCRQRIMIVGKIEWKKTKPARIINHASKWHRLTLMAPILLKNVVMEQQIAVIFCCFVVRNFDSWVLDERAAFVNDKKMHTHSTQNCLWVMTLIWITCTLNWKIRTLNDEQVKLAKIALNIWNCTECSH